MTPLLAALLLAPSGTLVVLNKADHTASLIDLATGRARATVQVGVGPHECAVSPNGELVAVANYGERQPGNTLTFIDLAAGKATRTVDLGDHVRPHGVEWLDERTLLVTSETRQAVVAVDASTGSARRVLGTGQRGSHMLALSRDKSRVYTTNIVDGSLSAMDLGSGRLLGTVPTGAAAEGIDVAPNGKEIWVSNGKSNTVSVIDARTLKVATQIPTGARPLRVKLTPDGRHALVTCVEGGEIMLFDARTHKLVKAVRTQDLGLEVDPNAPSPLPLGVVIDPTGKTAYVACMAAQQVLAIDLPTLAVTRRYPTGRAPDGMALAP